MTAQLYEDFISEYQNVFLYSLARFSKGSSSDYDESEVTFVAKKSNKVELDNEK